MKFVIEQLALYPPKPSEARELLAAIGAVNWVDDHVTAVGRVMGAEATNEADLAFNYGLGAGILELEILSYTDGRNWMEFNPPSVSHIGMHCDDANLVKWREFFAERGILVAQEVETVKHTNPILVESGRHYQYVIFNTRPILGLDLKFIVRK